MPSWADFNTRRYGATPADAIRFNKMVELVPSGSDVIEVGAGDGYLGERLVKEKHCRYQGFDISAASVDLARKMGRNVSLLDVVEKPLPVTQPVDVIVAGEIIEHVVDTTALLRKLRAALKSGGLLILTTPNLASFGRRLLLLFGRNPHMEVALDLKGGEAGHLRYFVRDTLVELLKHAGFEAETVVSDRVNLTAGGFGLAWPARICPALGRSLIVRARAVEE